MTSQHIQFLLWHARRLLDKLGVAGVIGIGLLAFCAMYYFSSYREVVREIQSIQQKREVGNKASVASSSIQSPEIQLQAFYDSFPQSNVAPDAIARINEVALANGLVLEQGEYSVVRKEGDKLAQYGVVLPLKGDYIHLRKFIFQSLAAVPNLSLNGVEFQRQKISETTLEARVRMTIFLVDR